MLIFFLFACFLKEINGDFLLQFSDLRNRNTEKLQNFTDLDDLFQSLNLEIERSRNPIVFNVILNQIESHLNSFTLISSYCEITINCSDPHKNCTLNVRDEGGFTIYKGRVTFLGVEIKIMPKLDMSPTFLSIFEASVLFNECIIHLNVSARGSHILYKAEKGNMKFLTSLIITNLTSSDSAVLHFSEGSILVLEFCWLRGIIISKGSSFLLSEGSYLQLSSCNFSNLVSLASNKSTVYENIIFSLRETEFLLESCHFYQIKLEGVSLFLIAYPDKSQTASIIDISIVESEIVRGYLIEVKMLNTSLTIANISILECFFSGVSVISFENVQSSVISNALLEGLDFYSFFRLINVEKIGISHLHFKNQHQKSSLRSNINISETFSIVEKFTLFELFNVTFDGYLKRLAVFIFKGAFARVKNLVKVNKSSFQNTLIDTYLEGDFGLIHGGVLSFTDVNEVQIEDTLFINNSIKESFSRMGSVAIYYESTYYSDILFIYKSIFINNKASEGPLLLTLFGFYFFFKESFVSDSQLVNKNEGLGLALIKISCSVIEINNLFTLNNEFEDGLISITERFIMNWVCVRNWTVISNHAYKRGGGSLLLDGSSKNREVLLKDSLFFNNSAYTQNAAGIHIFHSSLFLTLNVTYDKCKFYYNIASLGTIWWLRVAKKNALFRILNSEFYNSLTYRRSLDFSIAYAIGAEKGSVFTVQNCIIKGSVSQTFGFYIKDLFTAFENVILADHNTLANYSSLFKVEAVLMIILNSTICNQSSDTVYFNVRDNATLVITNTNFLNFKVAESWLIGVTKSRFELTSCIFSNISASVLLQLASSGLNNPNLIQSCLFDYSQVEILRSSYSYVLLKDNIFKSLGKTIFSIDSSFLGVSGGQIYDITCIGFKEPCIIDSISSSVQLTGVLIKNMNSAQDSDLIYISHSRLDVNFSIFINMTAAEGRGLINSKESLLIINKNKFLLVFNFIAKTLRNSCFISDNVFEGNYQNSLFMEFFFQISETAGGYISSNQFKNQYLENSAILINGLPHSFSSQLSINSNFFENIDAPKAKGSCLNTKNADMNLTNNYFSKNKAKIAGAVFIYCDFREKGSTLSECTWILINNSFFLNNAVESAAALKWFYVSPVVEENNVYVNNTSDNGGFQFESFPLKIVLASDSNSTPQSVINSFRIFNHKSGSLVKDFRLTVIDTYGQNVGLNKLNIEARDNICEVNFGDDCHFIPIHEENIRLNVMYINKESPYQFTPAVIFGRTLVLRETHIVNNILVSFFNINSTYLTGTPSYTVFLNISAPEFFIYTRGFSNSASYHRLASYQKYENPNEIINLTSYSFVVPVTIDFCREGEYYDSEKNLCEYCRASFINFKANQTECKKCPEGLLSRGGNEIEVLPGFWRKTQNSEIVFECDKMSNICLGGVNSTCAENYIGNLCLDCDESKGTYMERSYTLTCRACPPTFSLIFVSFGFWIILFISCWLLARSFHLNFKRVKKRLLIKCLINFIHTFLIMNIYVGENAPYIIQIFLRWLNIISQGVGFWFSMECLIKAFGSFNTHYYRGLVELVLFHIFLTLFIYLRYKFNSGEESVIRKRNTIDEMLLMWYLFYPSIFDYILKKVMCIDIEGELYLLSSPNEQCFSLGDNFFFVFVAIFLLTWVLIGPLVLLRKHNTARRIVAIESNNSNEKPHIDYIFGKARKFKFFDETKEENICIVHLFYKDKHLSIELIQYLFKLVIYVINACNLNGSPKILILLLLLFYKQVLEASFWKYYVYPIQKWANFMTNFNYLLLSYAYLWLTIEEKNFGYLLFFTSFCLQIFFLKLVIFSFFDIKLNQFIQNINRLWKGKPQQKGKPLQKSLRRKIKFGFND